MTGLSHRALLVVVGVVVAATVAGMAWLWPGHVSLRDEAPDAEVGQTTRMVDATLLEVTELGEDDTFFVPGAVLVEITARLDDTGETVRFETTDETGDLFEPGQRVRLDAIEQPDGEITYLVRDFRRTGPLVVLAVAFLVSVIAFSRWQGVRALIGLGLTFAFIIGFILPAILDGRDPVAVALVGAMAIMVTTLYLAHGTSRKTTAAVVGTALALLLTGALAAVFVSAASITGFTNEEARLANIEVGGLSLRGLLLAGIIIGGLGVLDDVTMSQSSTVFELHRANPRTGLMGLFRGALRVGRDHIAATVNTLFLAYAGASLPLLILFLVGVDSVGTILTTEVVAVEIVRTLVGSIGLIAAVPLTSALAAALVVAEPASDGGRHRPSAAGEGPGEEGTAADGEEWVTRLRDAYRLPFRDPDR